MSDSESSAISISVSSNFNFDLGIKDNDYDHIVNANLEQTSNKILQRKCSDMENSCAKIINTEYKQIPFSSSNEKILNGIQSAKNQNGTECSSMAYGGDRLNERMPSIWDDDNDDWAENGASYSGNFANSAAADATSVATHTQRPIQSDEKSISITNRNDGAMALSVRSIGYNGQMVNKSGMKKNNNNISNAQRRPNDRKHPNKNSQFESVRPMKTQCKTTGQSLL